MRIGIDARMFGPKQGGLGRYVEQLILNLEKTDAKNDYVIFLNQENFNDYQPQNPRFKKVLAGIKWYGWQEQFNFPSLIKKNQIDLMHFPHWNVPLFYRAPFVVTIHDLILIHYPSRVSSTLGPVIYWLKYLVFRLILWNAVHRAKKIITPSEFTKKDIIKKFYVADDKIVVTYEGYRVRGTGSNANEGFGVQGTGFRKRPYILYIGTAFPHKNLTGLIDAFKIFYEKYSKDYSLILAGPDNYFYRKIKYLISNIKYPISYAGFVSDEELAALYQNTSLYVFPSLCEGFGLPGLEALSLGAPVVAAGNSCLPEILGEAAVYFDPKDPEEMAKVMFEVLKDENLRQKLVQNALRQLAKFSWEKCAQKTLQVYPVPNSDKDSLN